MALFVGPTTTGWDGKGWIKQPLTQEQSLLRMDLADALKRKNMANGLPDYQQADAEAQELVRQLKARKDQSRLGGLPAGPLPPEGDTTVVEKGAGPQPVSVPLGVQAGQDTPFTPVPEDRFAQPTQMASAQQIQDAYARRMAREMPGEPMGVPDPAMVIADQPEPAAPEPQVAYADPSPPPARVPEPTFRSGVKLPAGMRNANPGNLKYSGSAWQRKNFPGMLGPSTTHGAGNTDQGDPQIAFGSHMDGMKAAVHLARTKYRSGKNTVYSLIAGPGGWTPGYTPAANNIAHTMGVGVNDPINLDNPQVMGSFMRSLLLQEHGQASQVYTDDFILAAINNGSASEPATDENWIRGGNPMTTNALSPHQAMAYAAEGNPMLELKNPDPKRHPQEALIQALLAQQNGYAPQQGGGNWAPMVGPARTEVAQTMPIVAGGGNVNPVAFNGGGVASPDQIEGRKQIAAAMLAGSQGAREIGHPLQGAAQVAQAAAGAFGMHRANQQENQYRDQIAQALIGVQNGGSAEDLARLDPRLYMQVQQQQTAAQQREAELARQEAIRQEERRWELDDRQFAVENREPPRPPSSVQEFEYGEQNPEFARRQMELERAGAVNIDLGKEDYQFIADRAGQLQEVVGGLDSILEARSALDSAGGTITGAGAETVRLPLARIGAAFGVTDPAIVQNTETLGSELAKRVLTQLNLMKGAPSNRDLEFVQKAAGGEISLNEGSIRRLLDIAENAMYRAAERHNKAFDQVAAGDEKLARMAPFYRIELPERQVPEAARMLNFPAGVPDAIREQAVQAIRDAGNSPSAAAKIQQRINQQFGGGAFGGR